MAQTQTAAIEQLWTYIVGGLDYETVRDKLSLISNRLYTSYDLKPATAAKEAVTQIIARAAPVGSDPPLFGLAEHLLSRARRFQPWEPIIKALNAITKRDLGTTVGEKEMVLILQFYLPAFKALHLYQQLADQNYALPFAALLPTHNMASTKAKSDIRASLKLNVMLLRFRNLFVANVPILVSFGFGSCKDKTTFINSAFNCNSPFSNNSPFHDQSVDVILATENRSLKFHVLDCHGEISLEIIKLLTGVSAAALLHVAYSCLYDDAMLGALQGVIDAIRPSCRIIMLVHDCCGDPVRLDVSRIALFAGPAKRRLLGPPIAVPAASRTYAEELGPVLQAQLVPMLMQVLSAHSDTPARYFSLYEHMEQQLIDANNEAGSTILLHCRSDTTRSGSAEVKQLLHRLPEDYAMACAQAFPRFEMYAELCQIRRIMYNPSRSASDEAKLRKRESTLENNIGKESKEVRIAGRIISITQKRSLDLYEELRSVVSLFRFTKSFKNGATMAAFLSMDLLWREVFVHIKFVEKPKIAPDVFAFARLLLENGYSMEIIDGRTLSTMNLDFLSSILVADESPSSGRKRQLLVCSVLGQQSLGKSTLLNHLFGANFAVSHTRCTTGLHVSLFHVEASDLDILVLDSEGLFSSESEDRAEGFDNKVALLLLSVSNIVLLYVDLSVPDKILDVLHVAFYSRHYLLMPDVGLRFLFVHRNAPPDVSQNNEQANAVQTSIRSVSEKAGIEWRAPQNEDFIFIPTPFATEPTVHHLVETHEAFYRAAGIRNRNPPFLPKIHYDLLRRICNPAVDHTGTSSVIETSANHWISHTYRTWNNLCLTGKLTSSKNYEEICNHSNLSRLLREICKAAFEEQFRRVAQEAGKKIIASAGTCFDMENAFKADADTLKAKSLLEALKQYNSKAKGVSTDSELVRQYEKYLNHTAESALVCMIREFRLQLRAVAVKEYVQDSIRKVRGIIEDFIKGQGDDHDKPTKETLRQHFNPRWKEIQQALRGQLEKERLTSESITEQLKEAYRAIFKFDDTFRNHLPEVDKDKAKDVEQLCARIQKGNVVGDNSYNEAFEAYVFASKKISRSERAKHEAGAHTEFQKAMVDILATAQKQAGKAGNVCNEFEVQHGLWIINERCEVYQRVIQQHHYQFDHLTFFSVWFSYLFTCYERKFSQAEQKSIDDNMTAFENEKQGFMEMFTSSVLSRYNDESTTALMIPLIGNAIISRAQKKASAELDERLRSTAGMEPERLIKECESRHTTADIFAYVINTADFMSTVFEKHFTQKKESYLGDMDLFTYVRDIQEALEAAINYWKSTFGEGEIIADVRKTIAERDQKKMARVLFGSFKAYLSQKIEPEDTSQFRKSNFLPSLQTCPSNFEYLVESLPNTSAICFPDEFCKLLNAKLAAFLKQRGETRITPNEDALKRTMDELRDTAIGCKEFCPLCRAKCSQPFGLHAKHSTPFHRMTGFHGCHNISNNDCVLDICTSETTHGTNWCKTNSDGTKTESLPFEEFMSKFYPDWLIEKTESASVDTRNILRWVQARREIIEFYSKQKLNDTTPELWFEIAKNYCSECCKVFESCGGCSHKWPCGHQICAECSAKFAIQRISTKALCPLCLRSL